LIMDKIFKGIKQGNLDIMDSRAFSEKELKQLSELINNDDGKIDIVRALILGIPEHNRNYDWNVGSTVQHLDVELIIGILGQNSDDRLLNSIGLAFALGEFRNTNRVITDFLYKIMERSENSDAWWRAAFALENIGVEEAVNLLKMSLKRVPLRDVNYYLENIDSKKSVISLLILSNVENIE